MEGLGGHFAQGCGFVHSRYAHLDELALGSIVELLLDYRRLLRNNSLRQMLTENLNDRLIAAEASNVNRSVFVGVEDLYRPIFQELLDYLFVTIVGRPMQRGHTHEHSAEVCQ